jgi:hypothetical protein
VIDPLAAMKAACLQIGDGDADEIELEWRTTSEDRIDQPGMETVLTITVRREVRHFVYPSSMTGGTE